MKTVILSLGLILGNTYLFAQLGGAKWSQNGNIVSTSDFFGSTNSATVFFKTNNTTRFYISATGDIVFPVLSSSTNGFAVLDNSGKVTRINFSNSSSDVFFGNGTWGSLSAATGWTNTSGITFTNNKVGIGVASPVQAFECNGSGIFNGSVSSQEFIVGDVTSQGKNLRISTNICLDGYDPSTGMRNELCVFTQPLYINSKLGYNYNTIIAHSTTGNVGIGTETPAYKLDVFGDAKVSGLLNLTSLSLSGLLMDYTNGTGSSPGIMRAGTILTGSPRPVPECFAATIPLVNQINGMYHSWGYSVLGGAPNDMMMGFDGANGIIDVSGISSVTYAPRLLLNYYCGKDVAICTGTIGGNVLLCNNDLTSQVGIGTEVPDGYKLAVNGKIIAEEVVLLLKGTWPDFVFNSTYKRKNYLEKEVYLLKYKHLENIPEANEIEKNGVPIVKVITGLTQHTEENALDIIDLYKMYELLSNKISVLENKNKLQEEEIIELKSINKNASKIKKCKK